ncbi:hypothetical protein VTO73DRAFT_9911 [Trametes versicolor]
MLPDASIQPTRAAVLTAFLQSFVQNPVPSEEHIAELRSVLRENGCANECDDCFALVAQCNLGSFQPKYILAYVEETRRNAHTVAKSLLLQADKHYTATLAQHEQVVESVSSGDSSPSQALLSARADIDKARAALEERAIQVGRAWIGMRNPSLDAFYKRYLADTNSKSLLSHEPTPAEYASLSFGDLQSKHAETARYIRNAWHHCDELSNALAVTEQCILSWSLSTHLGADSSASDGGSDAEGSTAYESEDS